MITREYTDFNLVMGEIISYASKVNGVVFAADDFHHPAKLGWLVIPDGNKTDTVSNKILFTIKIRDLKRTIRSM